MLLSAPFLLAILKYLACRPRRSQWNRESGQSLAELALLLPVLLITVMGIIEISRVGYFSMEVANAARAGVQYGAQNSATASDSTGMQTAAMNDAANISGLTATGSHSCKCSDGSSTACLSNTCSSGTRLLEYVTVTTTVTINSLYKYPGIPQTFALNGASTERVAR
jgi:Flp pilus assembly protein TadG